MKMFLSYSTPDLGLVSRIAKYLEPLGEVFYWDKDKPVGKESWPTIYKWIDQADVVLALITGNTLCRAMAVGNEIGRAKAKGKSIVPLVAHDVPESALGCLQGIIHEKINPYDLGPAMQRLEQPLIARRKEIQTAFLVMAAIGLLGLFWLLSKE